MFFSNFGHWKKKRKRAIVVQIVLFSAKSFDWTLKANFTFSSWLIVNHELEVENFQKAVDVLSQVWEKTVIDGYLVYWRAVPVGKAYKPPNLDPVWVEIDPAWVQIVKCQDKSCCSPFETNWLKTIPQRFIPFPAIYEYWENGKLPVF